LGSQEEVDATDKSGVPWQNEVSFVSHQLPEGNAVCDAAHQREGLCMLGSSRNYDRQYMERTIGKDELINGYQSLIGMGADIIQADLAIEAGEALAPMQRMDSSKNKYFTWAE